MSNRKWIGVALLAAAAVSTNALADNRGLNTALGAVVGAVIGNTVGGQNGAVVGGVLGAVVGASASGRDDRRDDRRYDRQYDRRYSNARYQAPPVYYRPAPVPVYARPDYRDRYYHDVRRVEYTRYDRGYRY